ncbi:MAG: MATE family efflux transporter [Puniceicoccales bacterium]|jgi:MATE family multidrug resistance protein|nr:MATE family efflux transporter [Puniceicoccales bacterium]
MSEIKLTKYAQGSVRELFTIAWPMMLSSAAGCLMVVIDRIILGRYSAEAFNACFGVIQWYWAFLSTALEFILIAEVFVGQYNGAQRYKEIGSVIWQMIWFCLALLLIYIPLARFVIPYLVADNIAALGVPYLRIIVVFIPIHCIGCGALTAFFVGRGETKIISIVAVISNILNAILDYVFIFGLTVKGVQIIPEGGVIGAAIATVVAQILPIFLLFALFLQKKNRERFETLRMAFKPDLLKSCLRVGSPATFARFLNSFVWAAMTQVVVKYVTPIDFQGYGIVHSIYMLFFFAIEGGGVGTRTICSNAMGAQAFSVVRKNIHAWLKLGCIFIGFAAVCMLGFPEWLIGIFLKEGKGEVVKCVASQMLTWAWAVFVFDYLVYHLMNVLLATGDTKFVMVVTTLSFALLAVAPVYVGIVYFHCASIIFWKFMLLDCVVRMFFYIHRYRSGRWMRKKLI